MSCCTIEIDHEQKEGFVMLVGYARVSTHDQNLDLQIDALKRAGCEKIFIDKISGRAIDRPGLEEALAYIRPKDTIVIWRLDRLGRSVLHLVQLVNEFYEKDIYLKSIQEGFQLDKENMVGQLTFQIFAVMAEFERNVIKDRTMAGLASSRARGRIGGRKNKLTDNQIQIIVEMDKNKIPITDIAETFNLARTTVYSYLKKDAEKRIANKESMNKNNLK